MFWGAISIRPEHYVDITGGYVWEARMHGVDSSLNLIFLISRLKVHW